MRLEEIDAWRQERDLAFDDEFLPVDFAGHLGRYS
jgi:hypothetical protein